MSIKRSKKVSRFTTVDNQIVLAGSLSWQARGLLLTILSKPDHWTVLPKALVKETEGTAKKTAINGIYSILNELKDTGYVHMQRLANGTVDYTVFDTPNDNPYYSKPDHHNANEAKPEQHKPNEANDDALVKTDLLVNTDTKKELIVKPTKKAKKKPLTSLPENFSVSERVRKWAEEKGHGNLNAHLENFIGAAQAKGYTYADWDAAFMNAIRNDWAKLNKAGNGNAATRQQLAEQYGIDDAAYRL